MDLYKKHKINPFEKAEAPLSVIVNLAGAEKPTKKRAVKLYKMARRTEITFTKKELQGFDRNLMQGFSEELL